MSSRTLLRVDKQDLYDSLKTFLIQMFSPSQHQHTKQLLEMSKLGECSPIQYADHMWQTLGDHDPAILLLQIFRRSPTVYIQDALMSFEATDLDRLMEEAKWIMSHPRRPQTVSGQNNPAHQHR